MGISSSSFGRPPADDSSEDSRSSEGGSNGELDQGQFALSIRALGGDELEITGLQASQPLRELRAVIGERLSVPSGRVQLYIGDRMFDEQHLDDSLGSLGLREGVQLNYALRKQPVAMWRYHPPGTRCLEDDYILVCNTHGNIGQFGSHVDQLGTHWLHDDCTYATADEDEVVHMIRMLDGRSDAMFQSEPDADALDLKERDALVGILDQRCEGEKDFKLELSRIALSNVLGLATVERLSDLFPGGDYDKVVLRRCIAHGECINFHTDSPHAKVTMQIPLNGDDTYTGGRLVFATARGLVAPSRPAGSFTIHDDCIVHGVTKLKAGVRYSMFLLKH